MSKSRRERLRFAEFLHGKSMWLLGAVLLLIAGSPLVPNDGTGHWIDNAIVAALLVAIVLTSAVTPTQRRIGYVLMSVAVVARVLDSLNEDSARMTQLRILETGTLGIAFTYGCWLSILRLLETRRVTAEAIAAAGTIYLMIGLIFMVPYQLLDHLDPTAFSLPQEMIDERDPHKPPYQIDLDAGETATPMRLAAYTETVKQQQYIYFSFVTLTTLGYGGIAPRSAAARALAILEAVIGQLFVAVILARLVGLEIAYVLKDADGPDELPG